MGAGATAAAGEGRQDRAAGSRCAAGEGEVDEEEVDEEEADGEEADGVEAADNGPWEGGEAAGPGPTRLEREWDAGALPATMVR